MRSAVLEWALVTVTIMGLVLLTGASAMVLAMQFALCCLALPFGAAVLRDYARDTRPRPWFVMCWMVAALAVATSIGKAALRSHSLPVLLAFLLGGMALAALVFAWRWRGMARAPIAFPAGRLGG